MAQYRFLAADVLTGAVFAELPLKNSSFETKLNDSGAWSGDLLLTDPKVQALDWQDATIPGRIMVYVERDGALVYGGWIWNRRYQRSTKTLNLSGNDVWSYFLTEAPIFNNNGTAAANGTTTGFQYTNLDMLTIAKNLVDYHAQFAGGTIVNVPAVTSGVLVNQTYQNSQLYQIGQAISDMAIGTSTTTGQGDRVVTDGVLTAGSGVVTSASANFGSYVGDQNGPISGGSIPQGALMNVNSSTQITMQNGLVAGGSGVQTGQTLTIANAPVQIAGFDFAVDVSYDANHNFTRTLNLSYPRRGRTFAAGQLIVDLNTVLDYTSVEHTPANLIRASGQGPSANQLTSGQAIPRGAYPLLCALLQSSSVVSQAFLDAMAAAYLQALQQPFLPEITVRGSDPNLPFGSYTIGDSIRLFGQQGTDEFFPGGLDTVQRLVDMTLTPGDDGMDSVTLSFNNMPTFV